MLDILNAIFKSLLGMVHTFMNFLIFHYLFLIGTFLPTAVIDISFNFNCECISRLSAEKILNKKCTG